MQASGSKNGLRAWPSMTCQFIKLEAYYGSGGLCHYFLQVVTGQILLCRDTHLPAGATATGIRKVKYVIIW